MRYWDASALVSLFVEESTSSGRRSLLRRDPAIVTWWGSRVECASALNRLYRERHLDVDTLNESFRQLNDYAFGWLEVEPIKEVRLLAIDLLRHHPLRAADAIQLAAALAASASNPDVIDVVCSDERLSAAARLEGFRVL